MSCAGSSHRSGACCCKCLMCSKTKAGPGPCSTVSTTFWRGSSVQFATEAHVASLNVLSQVTHRLNYCKCNVELNQVIRFVCIPIA